MKAWPDKDSCWWRTVDQQQEPVSRSVQLPYLSYVTAFVQTILFLVYLFSRERTAVSVTQFLVIGHATPTGVLFQGNSI